jgi:hypothetical protein
MGGYFYSAVAIVVLAACLTLVLLSTDILSARQMLGMETPEPVITEEPSEIPQAFPDQTNTPRPTVVFATVTPAPPTPTDTPTPGPCQRTVQANDTLIGIIINCGHQDLDVLDEVLEINGLIDASALSLGQTIEVPRPTPTPDPNAIEDEEEPSVNSDTSSNTENDFSSVLFAEGADGLPTFTPFPTATLPAGVQWHTVQRDETIIFVVNRYGAGVEILSQLNPEITFSQCEFSEAMPYGGPSCNVVLIEGQRMRVPAPTPTPTLSPTPSGSETPTPQPSPTFNAPSLVSPGQRVLFRQGELVTLRWRATGTLAQDEAYQIKVTNMTSGLDYVVSVQDTTFIVPREWQERDGQRHDYEWQVRVINVNTPDEPRFITETRVFTWEATPQDEGE